MSAQSRIRAARFGLHILTGGYNRHVHGRLCVYDSGALVARQGSRSVEAIPISVARARVPWEKRKPRARKWILNNCGPDFTTWP